MKDLKNQKLIAYVNCSPWIEDGAWNISLDPDYFAFKAIDDNESEKFEAIDSMLEQALDKGIIHSYYIKRALDPEPTVHSL